jgi:hypothetical protein
VESPLAARPQADAVNVTEHKKAQRDIAIPLSFFMHKI